MFISKVMWSVEWLGAQREVTHLLMLQPHAIISPDRRLAPAVSQYLREVTLAPRPRGLHSALIAEIRSGLPSIVDDDVNDALQRRMGAGVGRGRERGEGNDLKKIGEKGKGVCFPFWEVETFGLGDGRE